LDSEIHKIAEREISRRVTAVAGKLSNTVLSIYAAVRPNRIEHLGSGIVLSIRDRYYLLTAAHLVESGRAAEDFFLLSRGFDYPVSLSRRFLKSADDGDLAISTLSEMEVSKLHADVLNFEDFFVIPPVIKGRGIATIGWPNTKNEISAYRKLTPTQMLISGPSVTATDIKLEEKLDSHFVYQRYRPKDCIDQSGDGMNSPKLNGLSGGLTIDLGSPLEEPALAHDEGISWHPVGILTMYDQVEKVVRSTRPHHFLRACIESHQLTELRALQEE